MKRPSQEEVHAAMRAYEYKIFDTRKGYDLNIVGVRAASRTPDVFDDFITVSYVERTTGDWQFFAWPITTDSGLHYIQNPIKGTKGAAFFAPGQYRGSHMLGKHKGYQALVQKTELPVYRLGKMEEEAENWKPRFALFRRGASGINIHRGSKNGATWKVGKWSAGCQVFQDIGDFEVFMALVRESAKIHGPVFSYTLLDEADLRPDVDRPMDTIVASLDDPDASATSG